MTKKKTFPVRLEEETIARLEVAAAAEDRDPSALARLLIEWGFSQYERVGSSWNLLKRLGVSPEAVAALKQRLEEERHERKREETRRRKAV